MAGSDTTTISYGAFLDELNARVTRLEGRGAGPLEWRAIETAPTEGNAVLVYSESLGLIICSYSRRDTEDLGRRSDWITLWDGERLASQPTHWMPLPAPPTSTETTS